MALRYLELRLPSYSSDTYKNTWEYRFKRTKSVTEKSFASLVAMSVETLLFFYDAR